MNIFIVILFRYVFYIIVSEKLFIYFLVYMYPVSKLTISLSYHVKEYVEIMHKNQTLLQNKNPFSICASYRKKLKQKYFLYCQNEQTKREKAKNVG